VTGTKEVEGVGEGTMEGTIWGIWGTEGGVEVVVVVVVVVVGGGGGGGGDAPVEVGVGEGMPVEIPVVDGAVVGPTRMSNDKVTQIFTRIERTLPRLWRKSKNKTKCWKNNERQQKKKYSHSSLSVLQLTLQFQHKKILTRYFWTKYVQ
jgi:hypothetical protein